MTKDAPPQESPALLDKIAEKTAQVLLQNSERYLQQLLAQEAKIHTLEINVTSLLQLHATKKSYLDHMADWHGKKTAAGKMRIALYFTGLTLLISAFFSITSSLLIIALGIYATTAFILQNHYTISTNRMNLIGADVTEMLTVLQEEVVQLSTLEKHLSENLIQLGQAHLAFAQNNRTFTSTIEDLETQITRLQTALSELEAIKTILLNDNERLTTQMSRMYHTLSVAQADSLQHATEIADIKHQLTAVKPKFSANLTHLQHIEASYQQRLQQLDALTDGLQIQLDQLSAQGTTAEPSSVIKDIGIDSPARRIPHIDAARDCLTRGQDALKAIQTLLLTDEESSVVLAGVSERLLYLQLSPACAMRA